VKYVIIIPGGAADLPMSDLGDVTPLESAATPNLDRVAMLGRLGTANTTPAPFTAGSDVSFMCLLGYDPRKYHTGSAPLEAAALGVKARPTDWLLRLSLVTTGLPGTPDQGLMLDHSAGGITDREARELMKALAQYWRDKEPQIASSFAITPGAGHGGIMIDSTGRGYEHVATTPPHEIPREPWVSALPRRAGGGTSPESDALVRLLELSSEFLPDHEINRVRVEQGLRPATMAWIWGQGSLPAMPSFRERFGLRGAMITAVDLLAGIASHIGWDRLPVRGMTGHHDTNYAAQGRATCKAIDEFDMVCSHIEAPEEASHQGDAQAKVAALEAIDEHIVGPVLAKLQKLGDPESDAGATGWRLLVLPDHYTLVSTRKNDPTPVPLAMAGAWVRSVLKRPFSERHAAESDLHIAEGHELMEYFLRGGLASVRGAPRR
jgi:2,3-bisphosphoglycerate-independent phosphoglycerate mutase